MQGIEGSYTLRYKMQAEMDAISALGSKLLADVEAVHDLVVYQNVHPLYIEVKELACCKGVDTVGNLWLSMFCAGWFSVVLVVAMMCYIHRLDKLPKKRSASSASMGLGKCIDISLCGCWFSGDFTGDWEILPLYTQAGQAAQEEVIHVADAEPLFEGLGCLRSVQGLPSNMPQGMVETCHGVDFSVHVSVLCT